MNQKKRFKNKIHDYYLKQIYFISWDMGKPNSQETYYIQARKK